MGDPTLGQIYVLLQETRDDVKDIREAVFTGHDGQKPLIERVGIVEDRTAKVEKNTHGAPMWTGIGSGIGAAIVVVLTYLGIKPPGQGQ